jgi:copper chaperone CopZ
MEFLSSFHRPARSMVSFQIRDMTSASSVERVVLALHAVDSRASMKFDLALRLVDIEPDAAEPSTLKAALVDAGFTPERRWPAEARYIDDAPLYDRALENEHRRP